MVLAVKRKAFIDRAVRLQANKVMNTLRAIKFDVAAKQDLSVRLHDDRVNVCGPDGQRCLKGRIQFLT
jgi:hypothetical protein